MFPSILNVERGQMFYRNEPESGPMAISPPVRRERGLRGTKKAVGAGALVALSVMAAPAIANASTATEIKITVSGALSGTLKQSPAIGCMDGADPARAIFAVGGALKGSGAGATYELVAETGANKPGKWTKFYPKSTVHLGFSDSTNTKYSWLASTGTLSIKPKSGTVNATFVPDVNMKGHKLYIKASWSC
jgi:hypothetical protein